MGEVKYTEDHEWIRIDGEVGTVGITNFAQEQLGDIVFVELPETGANVGKGDQVAVVESVKAASEIYAPVGGAVVEANGGLEGAVCAARGLRERLEAAVTTLAAATTD